MKLFRAFVLALTMMLTTAGIFASVYAQGGDATRGKPVFDKNCAVCHGDRGQGRVGATLTKDFPAIRVDALLKDIISNGVSGSVMPAWSKAKGGPLSDAEIDDVSAYVRSLGGPVAPTTGPIPTATRGILPTFAPNFPAGDVTRGAKVFADNCVVCHGERGEGRVGAALQKDWSGIDPEKFLDATIARGIGGSKMPAWAKSNGGPLTDQDIADAAAFIRTLKKTGGPAPTSAPSVPEGGPFGNTLALVCVGAVVILGVFVVGFGLAGARARK